MAAAQEFGTLEYVKDRYSQAWSWKVSGQRATSMIAGLADQAWCGDGSDEVIIPDNEHNVGHLRRIADQYPLEILSKAAWKRRAPRPAPARRAAAPRPARLEKARAGKQFSGKLLDFQREGLDFLLKSGGNALLADEMGLGKTVQTLAYLASEDRPYPVIIVAPLVTLRNWEREVCRFLRKKSRNGRFSRKESPSCRVIRRGTEADLGGYDFYIINYELLGKCLRSLSRVGARTLVCDEVQNMRSKSTGKYDAVRRIAKLKCIQYRIGLSGTPIYNRGSEIWPIVDILRPGMLGTFEEFREYFCYTNEKGKAIVLDQKRDTLRDQLREHVMLRRKKSDVLRELKDKVRYKEVIDADTDYYFGELGKIWRRLREDQSRAKTSFDKSASLQRAMQSERQAAGAAKLPHVISFVKNIMDIEESVVVFCHHRAIHELLHRHLSEFSPVSVIGGQSDASRQDAIDRFQSGESKLMIAGLRAGNVGINLSRARYVIFAELDWSPAIHRQAEDRLHRIGQKNTVFAYYLIGNGTLDDHVAGILVDKSYEIDGIMDGMSESYDDGEKARLILAQIEDRLRTVGAKV